MNLNRSEVHYFIKLATLLHDIGKVSPRMMEKHEIRGADFLSKYAPWEISINGNAIKLSELVRVHHKKINTLPNDLELELGDWFILLQLADKASSAIDKSEKLAIFGKKSYVEKSHPILGTRENLQYQEVGLHKIYKEMTDSIQKVYNEYPEDVKSSYNKIVSIWSNSKNLIHKIPSDSRFPVNDHSLFSHTFASTSIVSAILDSCLTEETIDLNKVDLRLMKINYNFEEVLLNSTKPQDLQGRLLLTKRIFKNLVNDLNSLFCGDLESIIYPRVRFTEISSELLLLFSSKIGENKIINCIKNSLYYEDFNNLDLVMPSFKLEKITSSFIDKQVWKTANQLSEKLIKCIDSLYDRNIEPEYIDFEGFTDWQIEELKSADICQYCKIYPVYKRRICKRCFALQTAERGFYLDNIGVNRGLVNLVTFKVQELENILTKMLSENFILEDSFTGLMRNMTPSHRCSVKV